MLRKYDALKSSLLLALAAAGGAFSLTASAGETACTQADGYATNLAAYVTEASTCVGTSKALQSSTEAEILDAINAERATAGLSVLNRRTSLDLAAQAHALDMAARIYADHVDLEGRDHLHRIRAFDRTMLVGASGSNIMVSHASETGAAIHALIKGDELNAANIMRDSFTDIGIGVVEEAGQYYIVQVFAAAEGSLKEALPVNTAGTEPLKAKLLNKDRHVVAWGLIDSVSQETLASSKTPRVRFKNIKGAPSAGLDILVASQSDTYVLKGPLFSGR